LKVKGTTIPKITLKETPFVLSPDIKIHAKNWDAFFREIRIAFLEGILKVNKNDIERARTGIIQDFIFLAKEIIKPEGKLTLKDIGISSTDDVECLELVYRLGIQYEDKIPQFNYLEMIIIGIRHLLGDTAYNADNARAVLELFSNISWYTAISQKPFRDAYLNVTKGRPKKYVKERQLLDMKEEELIKKGEFHSSNEVLEAVEEDRGRRFSVRIRSKLLEAWTTEKRRKLKLLLNQNRK
jgi:hypothetical protein